MIITYLPIVSIGVPVVGYIYNLKSCMFKKRSYNGENR